MERMLNNPDIPTAAAQLRVLEALQDGVHTWSEIQAATKLNDDYLGIVIAELFEERKVWRGTGTA